MIFEELDFEFFNVFTTLAVIVILYFAWKSTNVRDIPPTAVLIIENNRRRLLENIVRPQAPVEENTSEDLNDVGNQRIEELNNIPNPPAFLEDALEEGTDLTLMGISRSDTSSTNTNSENILEQHTDSGPQEIIQNMDNTLDEPISSESIRRRRLAFYNQNNSQNNVIDASIRRENLNLQTAGDSTHAENCSNENNENENISKSESSKNQTEKQQEFNNNAATQIQNDQFVIKLKYLNDDLRFVTGSPQEPLGEFKKRHFSVELASEKLVRLVFNGHVLQPDTKTLHACGLFDNCVVHCLVHKKPNQTDQTRGSNTQQDRHNQTNDSAQTRSRVTGINFRPAVTNGPLFVYLAVGLTCIAIVFCWYCRYQYGSLFSMYSTIGLVFMTALFLLIFPLLILIEREISV